MGDFKAKDNAFGGSMDKRPDDRLMSLNGLKYSMPQNLSSSVHTSFKKQYAQKSNYSPGNTIIFDLNTGSDYIDPTSCSLVLPITFSVGTNSNNDNRVTFGGGSAANLIETLVIKSKSGVELERLEHCHYLSKIRLENTVGTDGKRVLDGAGHGVTYQPGATTVWDETKLIIPMQMISKFWNPVVKGMKIPGELSSGMRLELTLTPAARALTLSGTGTVVGYTIADPVLWYYTSALDDPTQAALMSESANNSLEYTWHSYFATHIPAGTATTVNEQVKKAVSQAVRVFTVVYDTTGSEAVSLEAEDGFASIPGAPLPASGAAFNEFVSYQYRVGSQYFPQSVVSSVQEAEYHAACAFNNVRDLTASPSSPSQAEYQAGSMVLAAGLEKDSRLNLSGIPLNNSNVCELRLVMGASEGSGERDVLIFIEYVSVARSRVGRVDLKI